MDKKNCFVADIVLFLSCLKQLKSLFIGNQPIKNATKSPLSFDDGIPAKAIAFPGANAAGDLSHLSRFAADHFSVALDDNDDEQLNPSPEAMLLPPIPPRAGPTE